MQQKLNQSLTGYIKEHIDDIESQMEIGISQETIVDELRTKGFQTTLASFRNLFAKARKWRNEKREKSDQVDKIITIPENSTYSPLILSYKIQDGKRKWDLTFQLRPDPKIIAFARSHLSVGLGATKQRR